jgi:hypothetical protein
MSRMFPVVQAALLGCLLVFALPQRGMAQASPDGAEALKSELQGILDLYNAVAAPEYGGDIYFVDEIAVTPADDRYEVLLRNLRVAFASEEESFGLAMGDVSLDMAPLGDQRYAVSGLGPLTPFTVYGDSGQAEGQVTFEAPRLEGVLSTRFMNFLQLDAGAEAMEVTPLQEPGLLRSGAINMLVATQEPSPGVFDQEASSEFLDITFREGGSELMRIDRVFATSSAKGIDAAATLQLMEQLSTGELVKEYFDIGSIMAVLPGFGDSRFQMDGLSFASDDGTLISLGQVIFAGGYEGGDGPLSSGHFELSFLDIGASGPGLGAQGLDPRLIPTHFSLKASMDKLPNDDILDFLSHFANTAALADAEEAPDLDPEATMMLADDLVNSLAASGSTFTIDELSFANKVSALAGTGRFRANPQAAFKTDGFFRMQVAGMSNLQAMAQEMAASQNPEVRQNGQGLLGMLGLMMIYAQGPEAPEPTVQGALAYDFKLLPNGSLTINGTPLLPPAQQ